MTLALKELDDGIVYGIDAWDISASISGMDKINSNWCKSVDYTAVYVTLVKKIRELGCDNYINLIKSTSKDASLIFNIDLLQIDGNPSKESSLFDVMKWTSLVSKREGIIVFHDTNWKTTFKAVTWVNKNLSRIADYHDEASDRSIWIKE